MNNWDTVNFDTAPLEIIDGDRGVNYPKQSDFMASGYCLFLNAGNVTEIGFDFSDCSFISEAKDNKLRKGKLARYDTVLTTRGTVGNLAYYDDKIPFENIRLNSGMVIIRPNKERIFPRYLYFLLKSSIFSEQVIALTTGSAQPQLPIRDIKRIEFSLPPIPEQRAIAGILGALDDKIELNRRMNRTLESMARAVFRQWFVESEDVEDWEVGKLSEICTTQYGFTASASDKPVGPKFLRITDMNKEPWIVWADVPYCEISEMELEKYKLGLGDILVSRIADPGKAGIVEEEINAVFASYLVRLKLKDLAWSYFAYYFLRSEQYLDYANGAKSGSVQSGMNARVITDVNLSIPPDEKVVAFYEVIKPFRNKIVANLKESHTLAGLRDSLLPKLMRGEVRVKL